MNKFHILAGVFFVAGLVILLFCGNVKGGFFLFFPFIVASGFYALLGAMLIFIAFFLLFLGMIREMRSDIEQYRFERYTDYRLPGEGERSERKVEGGGVVMVGPIPIVFGTSSEIFKFMLAMAILMFAMMALMILFTMRF